MAIEDWTKNPDGSLVVSHLLGWETIVAPTAGAIRLQTAATSAEAEARQTAELQVALASNQLRDLAQAFLKMADQLDETKAATQN